MNERDFALMVYSEDLARLAEVDGSLYLIRPGSRLNISVEEGLADVADALNKIITPSMKTCVLLDTMAGEGTQVGTSFEQLAAIIAKVDHPEHVGVCFDWAGVWAEGYDIVGDLDGVLEEFDRTIGLNKLKAVHLNDATHERGSHVDRHARIGKGKIGFDALAALVNHPKLAGVPFYLEEPDSTLVIYERDVARFQEAWGRKPQRISRIEGPRREHLGAGLFRLEGHCATGNPDARGGKAPARVAGAGRRKARRKRAAPGRSPGPGRERPQQDGRLRRGAQERRRGPAPLRKSAGPQRPPGLGKPGGPPARQRRERQRRARLATSLARHLAIGHHDGLLHRRCALHPGVHLRLRRHRNAAGRPPAASRGGARPTSSGHRARRGARGSRHGPPRGHGRAAGCPHRHRSSRTRGARPCQQERPGRQQQQAPGRGGRCRPPRFP